LFSQLIETQFNTWIFETFLCVIVLSRLMSRRDSSLTLMICHYTVIKTSWPWGWLQMWPKHVM